MKTQILFLMALLCAVVASVHSTQANTIRVTNTNDSGPGSLREALAVANNGDTIDATRVSGTIFLTSGALQIAHSVRINGPGAENLAVNGHATFTVLENFASNVTISGFTITNGVAQITLPPPDHANGGGGIYSQGGLTLSNSSVVNNTRGGICNNGPFNGLATLTITNCTVSGTLTVSNCTISNNSASNGGGIYNNGEGVTEVGGTILEAGSSGENIFNNGGTVTSHGYNLATDNGGGFLTGPGDQINTHPLLGPLQDNGGPTFTHALFTGSPAINAGDGNFTSPPFFDQRGPGYHRVVNHRTDIGSFEVQATPTPTIAQ